MTRTQYREPNSDEPRFNHADGWQRFLSWDHDTLCKLAADLLIDNKRMREHIENMQWATTVRETAKK